MEARKIAVIEDSREEAARVERYFARFGQSCHIQFNITVFGDAESFLEHYKPVYDLVLMDIMLPGIDGMAASARLRKMDESVMLVFITNMFSFAVKGYEVNAFDFIVKPVNYSQFTMKMQRILPRLTSNETEIVLNASGSIVRLRVSQIYYIESNAHRITYHTVSGKYEVYGSMKETEASLGSNAFARCNNSFLVNMNYVQAADGFTVNVNGDDLPISRPRKKAFMEQLTSFLGGNL